ncbi:sensor domain-containing diguanylate cyclase [Clostridium pasteurianum]|uniref:Diguanylate cyclase (GGDEF) domain-containing protein n=1 Tax=Clostridium pasteurianum BC1 TaxID=86416 RepID=R4K6P9_CLOPA|nr:GGDEF domain-containing protein [Clostridium pasteurianum]AGK98862.1 diguanylate cyclase (GGDEF) domain-containing protein [Clostridium pasteurianum BC1]
MVNMDDTTSIDKILWKLDKFKYENCINTIELGEKAYELCKKINYTTGMAVSLLRIGEALTNIGNYEKSLVFLFKSLSISQKESICDIQVLSLIYIGNNLLNFGDYEKSFNFYNNAEKIALKINVNKNYYSYSTYKFYLAKTSTNIGEIYKSLGDYENAFIFYNKAETFNKKLNYISTLGISLCNLGEMNYIKGHYEKALTLLNKSIELMNSFNYKLALPEAYRISALIYERKEDFKRANQYFCKALDVDLKETYIYYKATVLLDYSNYLKNRGNINSALDKLEIAFNISIKNNILVKTIEICKRFFKLYEEIGDIKNSYKYYKLYFQYQEKFEKTIHAQRLNSITAKIKLQELQREKLNIMEKSENFRKKSEKLMENLKNISIISELGQRITSTLNLDEILDILCNSVRTFVDISTFGIALYDEDNGLLKYNYYNEDNKIIGMADASIDSKSSIAAYCLRNKHFVVINDIQNEYSKYVDDSNYLHNYTGRIIINSAVYFALIIDNNLLGVMTAQSTEIGAFKTIHIEMLKALSAYASIAVNNAIKSTSLKIEIDYRKKIQQELEELNNKLLYISENDSLTGIPNRRKFDSVMNIQWDLAKKNKHNLSLILLDVDCFKQYNDNYGHVEGDNCLAAIGSALSNYIDKKYIVARYGGDEFVIIFPNISLNNVLKLGEKFRTEIENLHLKHEFSNIKNIVTITLGAASVIPNDNITINEFIRQADTALYAAKERGRNQIAGYVPK